MRERARSGEVVLLISDNDDRVRALLRLDNLVDAPICSWDALWNPRFCRTWRRPKKPSRGIPRPEGTQFRHPHYDISHICRRCPFTLLAAVWFGLNFATKLVRPIGELINAAERIRAGDLSARVSETGGSRADDELATLGRAFNRGAPAETQRADLIRSQSPLDLRRRFTEAVLAGVSAGVIEGSIRNSILIDGPRRRRVFSDYQPRSLGEPSFERYRAGDSGAVGGHAAWRAYKRRARRNSPFGPGYAHVAGASVIRNARRRRVRGYVVTFDNVSDLVSAQRKAAWADVARRIAHEIRIH